MGTRLSWGRGFRGKASPGQAPPPSPSRPGRQSGAGVSEAWGRCGTTAPGMQPGGHHPCRVGAVRVPGFWGPCWQRHGLLGGGLGHRERGGALVSLLGSVLAASSQLSQAPRPCVLLPVRAERSPSLCPPHPSAFSGLAPSWARGEGRKLPPLDPAGLRGRGGTSALLPSSFLSSTSI